MKKYIKSAHWQEEVADMVLDAYDAAVKDFGQDTRVDDVIDKLEEMYEDELEFYYDMSDFNKSYRKLWNDINMILNQNQIYLD